MLSSCCVPMCKSNYSDTTTVFKFPKDEIRRKKWLNAIHRENFEVTDSSVVCIKHFDEKFIMCTDTIKRPDGTILSIPRTRIKLSEDAFATIFISQPAYMNMLLPPTRTSKEEKKKARKQLSEDIITAIEDLQNKFQSKSNS
ncbi:hypothetical protein ILUMI_10590, partial [Ignelater luminosus]